MELLDSLAIMLLSNPKTQPLPNTKTLVKWKDFIGCTLDIRDSLPSCLASMFITFPEKGSEAFIFGELTNGKASACAKLIGYEFS